MAQKYIDYFFVQGEAAEQWLDIFDKLGAVSLIETLASVNLLLPPYDEAGQPLSSHLDHEAVGDFTITYSFALGYIGISKPCPMGEIIDITI